jgi:hypothetical protein
LLRSKKKKTYFLLKCQVSDYNNVCENAEKRARETAAEK